MTDEFEIARITEPTAEHSEAIRVRLAGYNLTAIGRQPHYPVVFYVRGEGDEFVGGLTGDVWLQRLTIDFIWIDERLRGRGIGRQLIEAAERYAVECGATHVHLDSYDFQAGPEFYRHLGYERFGVLGEAPEPVSSFMWKRLIGA